MSYDWFWDHEHWDDRYANRRRHATDGFGPIHEPGDGLDWGLDVDQMYGVVHLPYEKIIEIEQREDCQTNYHGFRYYAGIYMPMHDPIFEPRILGRWR